MATQEELDEAKAALHKLLTGTQAVTVTSAEGDTVIYQKTDQQALRSYITELEAELAGTDTPRRRALRIRY